MSRVDPPPSSGAARKDPDILVRGVYETGVVEWRFSRSLLSSKSKWFAAACHPNAFREGETGVITIPLTESPEFNEDADNLDAFRFFMHFVQHDKYCEEVASDDPRASSTAIMTLPEHAMVYAVADKYGVMGLKTLAGSYYERALPDCSYSEMADAINIVDCCFASDVGDQYLQELTASYIAKNLSCLIQQKNIQDALKQAPDFTVRVIRRLHSLSLLRLSCLEHDAPRPCYQYLDLKYIGPDFEYGSDSDY